MTEEEAKAIHQCPSPKLKQYSYTQLRSADDWVKCFAMKELKAKLKGTPKTLQEFTYTMVRCHYGSVEVDKLLTELGCYPAWIGREG